MSLRTAIDIVKPHLTGELQIAIAQALETSISDSELDIPLFFIKRLPPFESIRHTNERRLIGSTNPVHEKCLRDRLAFMNESLAAGSTEWLWFGYFVNPERKAYFMVDEKRKALFMGPYP
jgi:hypothetical protein